jgi:hypothetical protein
MNEIEQRRGNKGKIWLEGGRLGAWNGKCNIHKANPAERGSYARELKGDAIPECTSVNSNLAPIEKTKTERKSLNVIGTKRQSKRKQIKSTVAQRFLIFGLSLGLRVSLLPLGLSHNLLFSSFNTSPVNKNIRFLTPGLGPIIAMALAIASLASTRLFRRASFRCTL